MNFLQSFKTMPWQFCERLQKLHNMASSSIVSDELHALAKGFNEHCAALESILKHLDAQLSQKEITMGILKDLLEQALAHLKSNPEAETIVNDAEEAILNEGETLIKDVEAKVEPTPAPQ